MTNLINKKPDIIDVLEILKMKADASKLYGEIDIRVEAMMAEFGAARFDYDLGEFQDSVGVDADAAYLKFEIEDNISALTEKGVLWKSASFKAVSFSSGFLKRCPASLKVKE